MIKYYKTTTLVVSVHPSDCNAIYGTEATHVKLDDEAGGGYIVLEQNREEAEPGKVTFDIEELEAILIVARKLVEGYRE
jgi:hypothetical protein